ncbi:MAG: GNAT family N-acetyltransferase, partial [Oscillospiraceae bacterium]|nr:GNAT family N-acetyltransferase [Oscillospiraceae bacterium]
MSFTHEVFVLRRTPNLIFTAEHNGKIIGVLSINNYKENGYIYLDDFCVSEEFRGKVSGS